MSLLDNIARSARALVPARCPRCQLPSPEGYCDACRADFARIAHPCGRCGQASPCGPCPGRASNWHIEGVVTPFVYCEPLAQQLQSLKYSRRRELGLVLGRLLGAELHGRAAAVDALVPVPLHPRRLRERSFNQADEIARPLARQLGCPIVVRGVSRRRDTPAQAALDRRARLASLARAFAVANSSLAGLKIAIIDDVITTGATVNALAAALKSAGAVSVVAWAVARTAGDTPSQAQSSRNR